MISKQLAVDIISTEVGLSEGRGIIYIKKKKLYFPTFQAFFRVEKETLTILNLEKDQKNKKKTIDIFFYVLL